MFGETTFTAQARIDAEGKTRVSITAICPYGERTASVTEDIEDDAIISSFEKAFAKALKEADHLRQRATAAAAESLVVANNRGETV